MNDTVTITRHEMAEKCAEALRDVYEDEDGLTECFMKGLILSGLIVSKVFKDEEGKE